MLLPRTPLLIESLLEYTAAPDRQKVSQNTRRREAISRISPRERRHLQRAAIAYRRAGGFGLAGIPGARKQVRVGTKAATRLGEYIPTSVLQKLATGGARRSIPFGKLRYGHRGMSASAAVRYQYGRSGIY